MRSLPSYSMARSIVSQKGGIVKEACCVCGATKTTLYKNGEERICRSCRKIQMTNTGGDD